MSVVALVIAPSIAMDSSEMTAYNLSQSAQEQTVELVVPGEKTDKKVEVTITTEKGEDEMTVQVTADSKSQSELHKHIEEEGTQK
jgi:copper(I)-binding protein